MLKELHYQQECDLNTSYVKVQLEHQTQKIIIYCNLNTSYVKVQFTSFIISFSTISI